MASTLFNRPAASYADAKADKVTSAVNGNFAALDANGNLTDSGHASADYIFTSEKGAVSGVAELDSAGKVPANQLPSYVDDVVEYNSLSDFPATGESGKIYIAKDTNITYRWGGSEYVPIGSDLALGETSSTAYRGDKGAAAYAAAVTNVETTPTSASTNLITSGGVYTALGDYAPKDNPIFTTAISIGRKANTTVGSNSVAEGTDATASGANSHAEGAVSTASGSISHAEGANTISSGTASHTEGGGTNASGNYSHAEGSGSQATSTAAHAEGTSTVASNSNAHAEGNNSTASGEGAHAEGYSSLASGDYTHAEGYGGSYTQNDVTYVSGATTAYSHSEGYQTIASGGTFGSHAEGYRTRATGTSSHAEGLFGISTGAYSHAEGQAGTYTYNGVTYTSEANGTADHVEGYQCLTAMGQPGNHAEGYWTRATGGAAHSEGVQTLASGNASHAEGNATTASVANAHAEGYSTTASGHASHAEGAASTASGGQAHAEGGGTTASGSNSHSEGNGTIANHASQHAFGAYNVADTSEALATANGNYIEIVGNGTANNARSNARTLDWSGNERLMGQIYVGCNADSTGGTQLTPPVGMTGATSSTAGTAGYVPAPNAGDENKFLKGDGTFGDGGMPMVILSYGNSTWADFEAAYNNNVIVYCRASSNSNPATGSQTRMAFMAYVNNATTPTEVEFQYYRSVSSHSATQMGDQVFVYKLNKTNEWSVTTREASIKGITVGTGLSRSWSSNVVTIDGVSFSGATSSADGATGFVPAPTAGDEDKYLKGNGTWGTVPSELPSVTASDNGKFLRVVNGEWATATVPAANGVSF